MVSPKRSMFAADKLDLYEKLIATHPKIEHKGAPILTLR